MDPAIASATQERRCDPGDHSPGLPVGATRRRERPLRILHLEDSPSDAELAREHLATEGITCIVRRVETQEDYVAALNDGGIDLIVADYQLPDFDGLSAYAIARQQCQDVPFLILTGKPGEEYAIDTLKLGVTDYILKQHLFSRLAPATHDLRTPLVIIGGFTKRLEKSCADKIDAADLEHLRRVIAAADEN